MLFLWLCLTKIQLAITRPSPYTWVPQKREAEFGPIYAHTALMNFRQEIFLIAGARHEGNLSDEVWRSDDKGKTWQFLVPRSKRFNARRGHASVVDHEGVIFFVMGGFHGNSEVGNDCWSSEDGAVWHFLGHAPWSGRHGHAAVITSKSWIVVLGGHDNRKYLNDVWKIHHIAQPDTGQGYLRAKWVEVAPGGAPWTARYGHTTLVDSEDRIFLLGGFFAEKETGRVHCFNDVWRSEDIGATWHLVGHAPWAGRYQHAAVISSQGMFVIGGLSVDLERLGDVWRSEDQGRSWREVTPVAAWPARYEHAAVVDRNGTMYVLGGISKTSELFADVWHSARTCSDHVDCSGDTPVCRDGTSEHFEGATRPVCVGICDRRIFDDCGAKEDCKVQHGKPTCVDPCDDKDCEKEQVCEVAPRDQVFRKKMLHSATAYCLSCSVAQTKASCGELRQCQWSTKDEACLMRCSVMDRARCKGNDHCSWKEDKCSDKK